MHTYTASHVRLVSIGKKIVCVMQFSFLAIASLTLMIDHLTLFMYMYMS